MTLYENWLVNAYTKEGTSIPTFWDKYMPLEQKIYEDIIGNNKPEIKGTIEQLAKDANMDPVLYIGFLDGISEALNKVLDINSLEATSEIDVVVNFETLYKKMVEYKASHLFNLPEWDNVFTLEQQNALYKHQKSANTVVRETKKVGRNEPCPCGSGRKYKQCCGA